MQSVAPADPAVWHEFWRRFRRSRRDVVASEPKDVFAFGDHRELADELAALVARGVKRATTSVRVAYDLEDAPLPAVGDLCIVLDGAGTPVCVIETTEVVETTLGGVDARFAADEGEGDGSLAWWRAAHESAFAREAAALGYTVDDDLVVVCERFRLVWPEAS